MALEPKKYWKPLEIARKFPTKVKVKVKSNSKKENLNRKKYYAGSSLDDLRALNEESAFSISNMNVHLAY